MASYTIVSKDCNERFLGEHEEVVTWTRYVLVRDAAGKVVNTGLGFETATEERRFVDGLSMGLRIAGHTVEFVEEVGLRDDTKNYTFYDECVRRLVLRAKGRVSA